MKQLVNDIGFTPVPGQLIVEAFVRPSKSLLVRLDGPTDQVPPDMQVFVLAHSPGPDWVDIAIPTGSEIIARPSGRLEFLLPRHVFIIPETDVVAFEDISTLN